MRSGFITLLGRPNAGKSTLLNATLGQKISIISSKPQTTRNRILGIYSDDDAQVILVDTPGVHTPKGRLHQAMVQVARDAMSESDAVCWVLDATGPAGRSSTGGEVLSPGEHAILKLLRDSGATTVSIALNKVDQIEKGKLLPVMAALAEALPDATIVPISALKKKGIADLLKVWKSQLPESEPLYPTDQATDVSERFVVAELIREKIFQLTHQEIPYATAVEIELFKEIPPEKEGHRTLLEIMARILVERDSQKGILIGKGGSRLKQIGTLTRKELEAMLGAKVFLQLHVSVASEWTNNPRVLRELGYE